MTSKKQAFTLIELLIVIAIIAIIAAIVFVALDPLTRFKDARDARRRADTASLVHALEIYQVDHKGINLSAIASLATGTVYMIGTSTTGCNVGTCITPVASSTACVDLTSLVTNGYVGFVPVSPNGAGTWSVGTTGYTIQVDTNKITTIRACEAENTAEIKSPR
jgi:prepilin-type N-terminal cleavage/methylation domain-containing protein